MFSRTERIVGVFVVLMAFLIFWSPILVTVSTIFFILFLVLNSYYRRIKPTVDLSKQKIRQKVNQSFTSDNRFGPNVRQFRTGRRQLPVRTRTVDNYFSNYSLDSMSANQFLQSDSFLSSMSGTSFNMRPQSSTDVSYSPSLYRPIRDSPISQLGNLPFVRLPTNISSEQSVHELKPKTSPVKPVTVRIAPMPHNMSKMTLSRLSSNNSNVTTTMGGLDASIETLKQPSDPKTVVDALKRSLRRKREPKNEIESEDIVKSSANKKLKRDSIDLIQIPNGVLASSKQSVKRQAIDGTELLQKRFKNNEILSSYSSLQSLQLSETLKNKRKLSPDSKESQEIKTQKTTTITPVLEEEPKSNWNLGLEDDQRFQFSSNLSLNFNSVNENSKSGSKKSYGLPLHLHSMEDHERDRIRAKNRLNRFLNAVKEVSSPTSESNEEPLTIETSNTQINMSCPQTTELVLPQIPAAAIFTNSRVETSVTTTLLNTPISSTQTMSKESMSPQNISVDNIESTSVINSMPNWPQNTVTAPIFTAKPAPTQSLFSVGTGSSRRIAQSSRRSRQKR